MASLSCEEECQIVKETVQTLQKESKRKELWLFYLVKMKKMTVWCSQHQKIFIGNPFKIFRNSVEWWSKHDHTYPNLAKLAKRYIYIPATLVPAKQVFSVAGEIVNTKRASLKPENVDLLIL